MSMVDEAHQELAKPSEAVKRRRTEEDITFSEKNAASILFPHTNAVVVILNINNYNIHYVLVNSESAVVILYFLTFSRMKLSMDRLERYGSLIQSFSGDPMPPGVITLPIKADTYP